MANGEWLTQLMAGLGGAFTGATQAKERMALEAEAERKRQEQENERTRLKRIQQLRGGPLTEASRSELLQLGETPSNISALQDIFTPKAKPTYEERNERGGVAIYEDGKFRSWKIRPPSERETPSGPTPADIRAARTELRGAETGFRATMGQRPAEREFVNRMTDELDTPAFQQAMKNWRADSTYAAGRREEAGRELRALLGGAGGIQDGGAPAPAPAAPMRSRIELDARTKMAEIDMDPTLTFQQKQEMKRRVQAQANKFLNP